MFQLTHLSKHNHIEFMDIINFPFIGKLSLLATLVYKILCLIY